MQQLRSMKWRIGFLFSPNNWRDIPNLLRIVFSPSSGRRYKYLFDAIKELKPRTIMEIGTWNGTRAIQMIDAAKRFRPAHEISYFGLDLFEEMTPEKIRGEFRSAPLTLEEVRARLRDSGANIRLYKGDTRITLPQIVRELPQIDLVFIDGGHSIEVIANDWYYVRKLMHDKTIVFFDDYWNREDAGCKKVIEDIDRSAFAVTVLPARDEIRGKNGILTINFVKVTKTQAHT